MCVYVVKCRRIGCVPPLLIIPWRERETNMDNGGWAGKEEEALLSLSLHVMLTTPQGILCAYHML